MSIPSKPKRYLEAAATPKTIGISAVEASSSAASLSSVAADLECPSDVRQRAAALIAELVNAPNQARREEVILRVNGLIAANV